VTEIERHAGGRSRERLSGRAGTEAHLHWIARSKEISPYDGGLHMFVEEARSPDVRRLRFLRWLLENNHFGRPAAGPASSELAAATGEEVTPSASDSPRP
jgi:hypothetical protein